MISTRTKVGLLVLPMVAAAAAPFAPARSAGAFPQVRWMPASSSNYSARSGRTIDRIVIHTIEGSEAGCISWFKNPAARVSAHYVVSYAGRITQMVADKDVAWHAGNSSYNARSIGIENEGYAGQNRWTDAQYAALAELVAGLCDRYGIPKDRSHVIGHKEVPNQSHWDPGPSFDWTRFMALVRGGSTSTTPPSPSRDTTHVVRSGETLSGIASAYGTTPGALAAANGITNQALIFPGQVLRIPGATVTAPRPTTPAPSGLMGLEVTADTLNVRDGVWGSVLGQVSIGERFVASTSQSGWYRIDWRGREAWVSGDYVRRVAVTAAVVTASALNVRSGPGSGYSAIGMLGHDQAVARLGQSGEWVQVQYDHRSAWVHGNYVKSVAAQ